MALIKGMGANSSSLNISLPVSFVVGNVHPPLLLCPGGGRG